MHYTLKVFQHRLKSISSKILIGNKPLGLINPVIIVILFFCISTSSAQNTTIVFHTKGNSRIDISKEIDNTYSSITNQINADSTGNCIYSWDVNDFQFIECTFYDGGSIFFPIKEGAHLTITYKGDFQTEISGADKTEVEYYRNEYKDIITRPLMIASATLPAESNIEDISILVSKYNTLLSNTLDSLATINTISPKFSKIVKNDFHTFMTSLSVGLYQTRYLENGATKVNKQDSIEAEGAINKLLDKIYPMIESGEIFKYTLGRNILASFYNYKYRVLNEKELLLSKEAWTKYLEPKELGYLIAPEEIRCKLLSLKLLDNYRNAEAKGNSEILNYISDICPQNAFLPYLKERQEKLSASINADHSEVKYVEDIVNTLKDLSKVTSFDQKILFIDMWATWCGPCIAEFKHKDKLHELLSNYKDVLPLYISIDEDKNDKLWREKTKAFNLNGYHLRANKKLTSDIYEKIYEGRGVMGVPQFVLLDKDGNILEKNLPWPHDIDKLKQELDKYIH